MNTTSIRDAEKAVLSAMLSSRAACDDALGILSGSDFEEPRHEAIFKACRALRESGHAPEPVSVAAEMGADLDRCGGVVYLAELYGLLPVWSDVAHYAGLVLDGAIRRRLTAVAAGMVQMARESPLPASEQAEIARDRIAASVPSRGDLRPLGMYAEAVVDAMEDGRTAGLSSGWPALDDLTHGLRPGLVYVVGARPGVGKSIVGLQLALRMEKHGKSTYFASLEMSGAELTQRAIAMRSGVSLTRIIGADLRQSDWDAMAGPISGLRESAVYVEDGARQTMDSIRAGARALSRQSDLGMVVVDYLQLVAPRDHRLPREQQVAECSRAAKALAKDLGVSVLLLSQLNRAVGDSGEPSLSNLRESGAVEQDADVVMLLHKPLDGVEEIKMIVAKNRSGRTGTIYFDRQGDRARITPAWRDPAR